MKKLTFIKSNGAYYAANTTTYKALQSAGLNGVAGYYNLSLVYNRISSLGIQISIKVNQ